MGWNSIKQQSNIMSSLWRFSKRERMMICWRMPSLALVNEGAAYLELGQHKKVLSVLDELEELIPKIPESQKDDIQILWGNLRAQLYRMRAILNRQSMNWRLQRSC